MSLLDAIRQNPKFCNFAECVSLALQGSVLCAWPLIIVIIAFYLNFVPQSIAPHIFYGGIFGAILNCVVVIAVSLNRWR